MDAIPPLSAVAPFQKYARRSTGQLHPDRAGTPRGSRDVMPSLGGKAVVVGGSQGLVGRDQGGVVQGKQGGYAFS